MLGKHTLLFVIIDMQKSISLFQKALDLCTLMTTCCHNYTCRKKNHISSSNSMKIILITINVIYFHDDKNMVGLIKSLKFVLIKFSGYISIVYTCHFVSNMANIRFWVKYHVLIKLCTVVAHFCLLHYPDWLITHSSIKSRH